MSQRNCTNYQLSNTATGGLTFPLSASFALPWIKVQLFNSYSFTIATDSGTAAGTINLRVSDFGVGQADRTKRIVSRGDEPVAGQSTVLPGSTATATLAAPNTAYRVEDRNLSYTWVQLTFTDTSSGANTGNVTIAMTQRTDSQG